MCVELVVTLLCCYMDTGWIRRLGCHGVGRDINVQCVFVTGRIDTGRAVRNREYQLDETRLDKEQIVNLSITYCKTIVN
jgi:hypothetical protein